MLITASTLVVGDRAAAAFTSEQIHDRVAAELAARDVEYGRLSVDVAGVPFLSQAFTGTLDKISISMTDLRPSADTTGGTEAVTIGSVDVAASGVRFNVGDLIRGRPSAAAEELVGTAFIGYAALDGLVDLSGMSLADVHFSQADGGIRFEALGALAPVRAVADIAVDAGHLRVKLRDAQFVSLALPTAGRGILDQILAVSIDLLMPSLPLGLTLQSVIPGPEGLSISVVGRDVPLTVDA